MEFDFDEASCEWRKNKITMGNGYFKYKCKFCNNELYCYTTENKYFKQFATDFDLENKDNPNKYIYCEDHLISKIIK
jgi:hypothetical protein